MYKKLDLPMRAEYLPEKLKELRLQQQKEDSKSWWQSAWSSIKARFGKIKGYVFGENVTPIPCVDIYLDNYFKLLIGEEVHPDIHPSIVAHRVVQTYLSLYKPYFFYNDGSNVANVDTIKMVSTYMYFNFYSLVIYFGMLLMNIKHSDSPNSSSSSTVY